MIERIEYEGKLLALVLRAGYDLEGANYITSNDSSLQLGILKHKKGTRLAPHIHRNSSHIIKEVQEVLHIEHGEVDAGFYNDKGKKVGSTILKCGDTVLLISGGHGFDMLEDCKIVEVKQGPYPGREADKESLPIEQEG